MEKLFTDFQGATADEWKARMEKDLKGITFEQLSIIDRNGLTIHPFYNNEDTPHPTPPILTRTDWSICSKIKVHNAKEANKQALDELNSGASGIYFVIESIVDVRELLQDIELPYIFTVFELSAQTIDFAGMLRQYISDKEIVTEMLNCNLIYDFVGSFVKNGSWKETFEAARLRFQNFIMETPGLHHMGIDATLFQNAGATAAFELACTLSQVNEYLYLMQENGNIKALNHITINIATDTTFFEQIAKLRALRNLLALVFEQYGINPDVHLHVETSNTYRSRFDSYNNLLRDSVAGMAAVIGGCNSLYIHPFDETVIEDNKFSKRMSRNQQLIFKEESYLDKVADISAGSYYIETLTEQLAAKAWTQFQSIEEEGGLLTAAEQGSIKRTIEAQAQLLVKEYKEGKRILIGVNKFVNPKDEPQPPATEPIKSNKGLRALMLADEIL